jgi:hypothetical protein
MTENQILMIEFSEAGQFFVDLSLADKNKKCNYCADILRVTLECDCQ